MSPSTPDLCHISASNKSSGAVTLLLYSYEHAGTPAQIKREGDTRHRCREIFSPGRRVALQPEAIPLVSLILQGQLTVMLRIAAFINIAAWSSLFEGYCHG